MGQTTVENLDAAATLKYSLLGPSLTKSGQENVDQQHVSEVIYNASKGSKYFIREEERDKILTEKIERILTKKKQLEKLDLAHDRRKADEYIVELELSRDLSQTIVHVDCDAFYAAVEELDRPDLKNVPFAVGHGVLTTCNYLARKFGCRSGMAGFVAKALCPHLIQLPLNFDKYTAKAQEIRAILVKYDPRFESASIDEAYLNITEYCRINEISPEEAVEQLRQEVHENTSITVSAGIAANAKLAKICSNQNKPNGQFRLPNDRTVILNFMRELSVRKVNGVGRVLERELDAIGIKSCGDIYEFRQTKVQPAEEYERKSVGTESTFGDIWDPAELRARLRATAEELAKDLRRTECKGRTLVLKVKLHTFEVLTRQVIPPKSVFLADDLFRYSVPMLAKLEEEFPGLKLRLMGLRCTHLVSTKKPDTMAFFGLKKSPSGSLDRHDSVPVKRKADDNDQWEMWPDELLFEAAERQEREDDFEELERLSQQDEIEKRRHHGKEVVPNPKLEATAEEEWWDCPICSRPQAASEKEFNEHIDLCLSRQTIRDAVQENAVGSTRREDTPAPKKIKLGNVISGVGLTLYTRTISNLNSTLPASSARLPLQNLRHHLPTHSSSRSVGLLRRPQFELPHRDTLQAAKLAGRSAFANSSPPLGRWHRHNSNQRTVSQRIAVIVTGFHEVNINVGLYELKTTASTPATPGPSTPTAVRTRPLQFEDLKPQDDDIEPPARPSSTPFPKPDVLEAEDERLARQNEVGYSQSIVHPLNQTELLLQRQRQFNSLLHTPNVYCAPYSNHNAHHSATRAHYESMASTSIFYTLPIEIHERILDYIMGVRGPASTRTTSYKSKVLRSWGTVMRHSRRREISEMALVCDKWRDLIQDRLYRHLKIKGTRESVKQSTSWFTDHRHLCPYVKHIEIWFPVFEQKRQTSDYIPRIPSTTPERPIPTRQSSELGNIISYQSPSNNCTLEEAFRFIQVTFAEACILTLEGGNRKKPPMVQHFLNDGKDQSLPMICTIQTLVCKGQWNLLRSNEDFQNIVKALPNLNEWHGSYAKPKSKIYLCMATIVPNLPLHLTHLNISLEGDYRREAASPAYWRKVWKTSHFCFELSKVMPNLEHFAYTGRICRSFFENAAKISDKRTTRLKSVELVVKNCCRPNFQWNDGSGITDISFILAFEALVGSAVRALATFSALEFLRIRFIDLESQSPPLNPYFQLENDQCTGIWSERIGEALANSRPSADFLEKPERTSDVTKIQPLCIRVSSYLALSGGITIT
ncbi:hypothetical protein B7494_g507 [Chlorociboria aeruginascens]|nr:hypothetical protein B7494_g507 [Chlorociboria aeruginascens]